MTHIGATIRGAALVTAFATMTLIQGCTVPAADNSSSLYNGSDFTAALDAAMTADNSGE